MGLLAPVKFVVDEKACAPVFSAEIKCGQVACATGVARNSARPNVFEERAKMAARQANKYLDVFQRNRCTPAMRRRGGHRDNPNAINVDA